MPKLTRIHDSVILEYSQAELDTYDYSEMEARIVKHLKLKEFPQCTHVSCDRGLGLHKCPEEWKRTKTGRLAWMYGGKNPNKIKGVTP